MNDQIRQIAGRIRELREILEVDAEELAGRVNVSPEVYQSYDEGLDDLEFPKFVLQPIIENCFMHSEMTDASLKIYIDVHLEETGHLNLKIQNSGPRISEERVKQINEDLSKEPKDGARIGMRNVYQRLQLLYYSAAKMKFYCDENIVVEIRLPLDGLGYSGIAR